MAVEAPAHTIAHRDIEFAVTPSRPLFMDIFVPDAQPGPVPAIVYVFGGAWLAGDRFQIGGADHGLLRLVEHGFAVAALDYRLSSEAPFPAQIEDVQAGLCWLSDHAPWIGIDPSRMATIGPSAGGHLAALAASSGSQRVFGHGDCARVAAAVDFFGPTDFLQMDAHSISDDIVHDDPDSPESKLVGAPIQSAPQLCRSANPITWIDDDCPPMLIVHGDRDRLVPHHQSELLAQALREKGSDVTFITKHGAGHGGPEFFDDDTFNATVSFLTRLHR